MHAGRIVASGSPGQLKKEWIRNPILEFRSGDIIRAMEIIQNQEWALETTIFGSSLHVSVNDADIGRDRIIKLMGEHEIGVENIRQVDPTLEDVFITLIEGQTSGKSRKESLGK